MPSAAAGPCIGWKIFLRPSKKYARLERWTLPFLDVYAAPEDMVAAQARDDGRLRNDRPQLVQRAA